MRKKLDTRFPAARIKKIMQTDEDVGKIAMAVPLLVSKALELFLQDLCDRTYEITIRRGAKTVNSLHLKQCVQSFNVFDFLREIVNKVPDLGGSDASNEGSAVKRRKVADDEEHDNGDEVKKERIQEDSIQASIGGRGRGRGRSRGRGRGRGSRTAEKESTVHCEPLENDSGISLRGDMEKPNSGPPDNGAIPEDSKETVVASVNTEGTVRNFDLNVDLDENGDSAAMPVITPTVSSSTKPTFETKHEEYPGWSFDDMVKMAFDPVQLANLDRRVDEEEEDYDEED